MLLILILDSCSESNFDNNHTVTKGYDYFPVDIGHAWTYSIDSTIFLSDGAELYKSVNTIREEVVDILTTSVDTQYIINKSNLIDSLTNLWIITDVYVVSINAQNATKTERNKKFIKLVFPIIDGKTWDGNIFFDARTEENVFGNMLRIYENWRYKLEKNVEPLTLFENTYNNVYKVDHINQEDKLNKKESFEYYAQNVGLIYKYQVFLKSQIIEEISWIDKAQEGMIVEQKLISFVK